MSEQVIIDGELNLDSDFDGVPKEVVTIVDDVPMTEEQVRAAVREGWGVI